MEERHLFSVSFAPHIKTDRSTEKIMKLVILSLMPSVIVSILYYGVYSLFLYLSCIIFCVLFEHLFCKIQGRYSSIRDYSAVLTGLLLAMTLPPSLPVWTACIGSFFAIVIGKMVFGGIGQNPFNPALTGRMILLISFPALMTSWNVPSFLPADAVSGATVLGNAKTDLSLNGVISHIDFDFMNLLISNGGSLGEISPLLLILGGLFLMYKRVISYHIPLAFILTVFLLSGVIYLFDKNVTVSPFVHVLSGGLLLGAFFMATDYSTSPMFNMGKIVFGIFCGVLTVAIRVYGGYPEGAGFAILIMNAFTPLLDKFFKPKVFGAKYAGNS